MIRATDKEIYEFRMKEQAQKEVSKTPLPPKPETSLKTAPVIPMSKPKESPLKSLKEKFFSSKQG
jgi:hypothetical protein